MKARQLPQLDYASLKAATRQQVRRSGGQEAAADITRVGHQELSNYGSPAPEKAERFMPVDIVADLEAECGTPLITAQLAKLSGHLLVPMPRVVRDGTPLARITPSALKEASDVFVVIGSALEDGKFCRADLARLRPEVREAMTTFALLLLQAEAEAGVGDEE